MKHAIHQANDNSETVYTLNSLDPTLVSKRNMNKYNFKSNQKSLWLHSYSKIFALTIHHLHQKVYLMLATLFLERLKFEKIFVASFR